MAAPIWAGLSGHPAEALIVGTCQCTCKPAESFVGSTIGRTAEYIVASDRKFNGVVVIAHVRIAPRLQIGVQPNTSECRSYTEGSCAVSFLRLSLETIIQRVRIDTMESTDPYSTLIAVGVYLTDPLAEALACAGFDHLCCITELRKCGTGVTAVKEELTSLLVAER